MIHTRNNTPLPLGILKQFKCIFIFRESFERINHVRFPEKEMPKTILVAGETGQGTTIGEKEENEPDGVGVRGESSDGKAGLTTREGEREGRLGRKSLRL